MVTRDDLDDSPLQQLRVTDPGASDHGVDEVIAFFCGECNAVDETARQLFHKADCSHAGAHGRRFYDKAEYVDSGPPSPEFEADTVAYIIEFGETEGRGGLCEGEVLGFECSCGMVDESLGGVLHAETCPLAHVDRAPSIVDARPPVDIPESATGD
jgi:hypothetical protein